MRDSKNPILFHIKTTFIIITLVFILIPINSCYYFARQYADVILGYSQEYGIEPALVFAIAETESNFNPQARSKVGAMGIMQIMPKTGEWIAACLSVENYKSEDLYIANTNLRFGIFYLSYLSSLFDEEWQVTAAYNAGEGTVKRWLAEGRKKETIPIAETARYVEKVEAALLRYRRKKFAAFD